MACLLLRTALIATATRSLFQCDAGAQLSEAAQCAPAAVDDAGALLQVSSRTRASPSARAEATAESAAPTSPALEVSQRAAGVAKGAEALLQQFASQARAGEARFGTAFVLGVVYSLVHVVSPDHLAIVSALSVSSEPPRAFVIGATWGLGHCVGMAIVAAIVALLGHAMHSYWEPWEKAGDYAIGATLVAIGLFFAVNESSFVESHADGSCSMRKCDHDHGGRAMGYLVGRSAELSQPQDAGITLLAVLQGMCCPRSLMCLGFVAKLPVEGLVCFIATFTVVAVLGRGLLAMAVACAAQLGFGACASAKVLYRASYCFTLCLGIVWTCATYLGVVDSLEYSHGLAMHAQ